MACASNSLKWDIKTQKSSDDEYDSDETCCDANETTAVQTVIQHLDNDLENNSNNTNVSNGVESQSTLSGSTKALIQSIASDKTFAQVVYLNDSLQDKLNDQTSNSERLSYFGFSDMDSTVVWCEKNIDNKKETRKEHDRDKKQGLIEKPENNLLLTAPLALPNCETIKLNQVIDSENDPHCDYSGKTALKCNSGNLDYVNVSGTEHSNNYDICGHHEGYSPLTMGALVQMNLREGELNLGVSNMTLVLECSEKNNKSINLSGKQLDEQNMCVVGNHNNNLEFTGNTDNIFGSSTELVYQSMSAENASNSIEFMKGLTENLLYIFGNNNNFNNFMNCNDTPLPNNSVCTPPYTLNTPTKINKTPTQKVLPEHRQKKKSSSNITKILPVRKCVSAYKKHFRRVSEGVDQTEIEETTEKTKKNLKPESEQYGVAKKKKSQRKQRTKHETNETVDKHHQSRSLVEIEEGRATLGNRMHRWLRGLEHMSREEAFQMHSEVQCYIKKIKVMANKQRKKRGAKKTDTYVDKKKVEIYLKCLNDWSRIIDNAIADFDNIILEEQKSSENCDDSNLVNKINVDKKELRSVLKNGKNSKESTETNSKHISFSDEVEYHYLTYSTQSSGKSSYEDNDYEENFSPSQSNTDESASNSKDESYSLRFSQESERNLVKCQNSTDALNKREIKSYGKRNTEEIMVEEKSQISLKSATMVKKLNTSLKVQTKTNTKRTRKRPNKSKQISCDRTTNINSTNNILNISKQTTQFPSLSEGKFSINDCNRSDNTNEICDKYQSQIQNNSPHLPKAQMTHEINPKLSQNLVENYVRNQCSDVNCTKDPNIIKNYTRDQNLIQICVKDQTSVRDYTKDINVVKSCIQDQSLVEHNAITSVCVDGKLSIEPSCDKSDDCIVQFVSTNSEGSFIHLNKIQRDTDNECKRIDIDYAKGEKSLEISNERTYDEIIMQVKAVRVIKPTEYIPISELPDNFWDYSEWFGDLEG